MTGPRVHAVTMPDGARLGGLLWEVDAAVGTVLLRTPYDAGAHASIGGSWARRGFHCLVQDVRGRYSSEGDWDPYQRETEDGAAAIAHLRDRFPHLPVVVFGASYAAHAALEASRGASLLGCAPAEAVIVCVPALGLAETAWDADGTAQIEHRIAWWHEHGTGRASKEALTRTELRERLHRAQLVGVLAASLGWDWSARVREGWERLWNAEPVDMGSRYAGSFSPLLVVTGNEGFVDAHAHRLAATWTGSSRLVTGPWGRGLAGDLADPVLRQELEGGGEVWGAIDVWLRTHRSFTRQMTRDPGFGVWSERKEFPA